MLGGMPDQRGLADAGRSGQCQAAAGAAERVGQQVADRSKLCGPFYEPPMTSMFRARARLVLHIGKIGWKEHEPAYR